jgi:hypothetical protein
MDVSGTDIMGANGQRYRKHEGHFGKRSSQKAYGATSEKEPPSGAKKAHSFCTIYGTTEVVP